MAPFSPLFLLGLVVTIYLGTFVLFAIIRIATGVSIQRIGYFSLRRISYTLKDGIRIDIRSLGLHFHRPTFARPTYVSLRIGELKCIVDLKTLATKEAQALGRNIDSDGTEYAIQSPDISPPSSPNPKARRRSSSIPKQRQTWRRLTHLKERIKALHEQIKWLKLIDVEVLNSSLDILEVANIHVGSLTMAIDTRRNTVDRGRLFRHKRIPDVDQHPAEWMFVLKGVLFTPDGKDSLEVLDICSLNVHGFLVKNLSGLRDASISLKLGRMHIPYDDVFGCQARAKSIQTMYGRLSPSHQKAVSFSDMMEELDTPGSKEEKIVQTVSDSREFIASILRGIQEIQMAVSFIGLSKEIRGIQPSGKPLYLNFAMNEFGIDLFKLDPKSPAHRMYFSAKDIAHQALLAAISIGVSIDDGGGKPERLLYVPMATTTVKSTLPSKTIAEIASADAAERNANILFANLVITSPSVDLGLKHMPIVLALLQSNHSSPGSPGPQEHRQRLISRLLPKASVRISVQEPVIRVVLPSIGHDPKFSDEYDLLIMSISSVSLDVESSHSSAMDFNYALNSNLRLSSQQLYYQTSAGERHNLLVNDALELRVQVTASPEISVVASANLDTFSIYMTKDETSKGVRQVVKQLKGHLATARPAKPSSRTSVLRRVPQWLTHAQFKGSNLQIEVAGVDSDVSPDLRGATLQLESWNLEYRAQRNSGHKRDLHRALSNPLSGDESYHPPPVKPRHGGETLTTDGRRMTLHVHGLQGFVLEGAGRRENEAFLSMPRFEVAMTTTSDAHGRVFHLNSHMRALYLQYSLYRYYSIGVAQTVVQKAFGRSSLSRSSTSLQNEPKADQGLHSMDDASREVLTIDVRASLIQVKGTMPADPPVMLRIYGADFGHHRWASPYLKIRQLSLYAQAPNIKSAWSGLVSVRGGRLDIRQSKRKVGQKYIDERSIDITTDVLRVSIPHQLVLHRVFDNFVNAVKATEQLHHRFKTGTNDYVLKKFPEGPKKVPRVSLRSKNLVVVLEDSSFECKLGIIYRVGLREQKQRMAREEAYRMKVKKLEEANRRGSSKHNRPGSPKTRGRSKLSKARFSNERSGSHEHHSPHAGPTRPETRGRQMRYDTEATGGLTGHAKISADQAWNKLQEHNSSSWKTRISHALRYQTNAIKLMRGMLSDADEESLDGMDGDDELILSAPNRPGLMAVMINDVHIIVDKPSFPISEYPRFLHDVGKGLPRDTQYSLLIPMNLQVNMGETRVSLRNYPLPLIHVPGLKNGQSPRLPCWSIKTDFVIAEEYRNDQSIKRMRVEVVPADKFFEPQAEKKGFFVDVRRTVSPVKTYSNVDVSINTSNPTSITWGTSYQPAIQDMMQIIENFTKPQVDPSEKVGFWDKIRLMFHSRIRVAWKGGGDVHLKLKGSRDPYVVTGFGAGFIMCFRNNVVWDLHQDDDPKKLMTVSCGEYVLAIPDYSRQAREASRDGNSRENESVSSMGSHRRTNAHFQKVIMKLSGNVRWLAGLVFERDIGDGTRSFQSSPHYDITLKTPEYAKSSPGEVYDAFRGFRSHHIHLSIAVLAPVDRDWSVTNTEPSSSYNSMHMSPRFFTHFFNWWSLFSGVMALPIRQGKLFPGIEKSTKKFGRHLATIKYNLLLSPFNIAHIYKHKDAEDYAKDTVGATGLKLRIDSFMLDLHQRREEFASLGSKNNNSPGGARTTGMKINRAQLDFISADLRAVSASIGGTTSQDVKNASPSELASYGDRSYHSPDLSKFTIPDNDFGWIDMDDFVELDWILPSETHPETKIMPLAFAPRFTYFRQTDHDGVISGDPGRTSHFGDEPTHFCIMSHDNDPQRVQCELIRDRIAVLNEQLESQRRSLGEYELRKIRNSLKDPGAEEDFDSLQHQISQFEEKRTFLEAMLDQLTTNIKLGRQPEVDTKRNAATNSQEPKADDAGQVTEQISDFDNRFIIHNVQLKWNNSLRNIILRYVHQVSQRRGFVYYMSRRAVKFILDIIEERRRNKTNEQDSVLSTPTVQSSSSASFTKDENDLDLEERIEELLNDGKSFVDADDPHQAGGNAGNATADIGEDIAEEYAAQNTYHVRLIAPQIQLQSEKNPKAVLLVTGKKMELKVVQIMDKSRLADEVSGLVQRRFSVEMDGVQFFVTNQKTLKKFIHLYTANRYGSPKGSAWPPWAPLEVNFDFHVKPFGWFRVVQETSASLRYDKYNTLRLKYNDEVSKGETNGSHALDEPESRIDHIWVDFPQMKAICDSVQYYSMYVIVLDLLLYNEPLEKSRSERLEKIMLAADFSDLTGAPEMVISLQERIRQLEEIKGQFQINAKYLDRQGWEDRLSIEQDLASCEDELFFIMKAITTSQRRYDDRSQSESNGLLRWHLTSSEIVWHLMREQNEPLMEIQLENAVYDRTDNTDGSNRNTVEVERIRGLNLLPNALYPQMIEPYLESGAAEDGNIKMFKVHWYMLEAIAGIPVLDQFEVNLFPLKVQLEREIGKKVFEYIFPANGEATSASPFMVKHMTPLQDDEEDELSASQASSGLLTVPGQSEPQASTRAGSIELRLRPTMSLSDNSSRPATSASTRGKPHGPSTTNGDSHSFRIFGSKSRTSAGSSTQSSQSPLQRRSSSSLISLNRSYQETSQRNDNRGSTPMPSSRSVHRVTGIAAEDGDKLRKFGLTRSASKDGSGEKTKANDDLTEMMSRASNYMTLAYVKIPSVVLCLSYKGRGERNIEDVHNFVFRMPALEYRNKTWSNLDLALRLKKDVIKALISHTGAIIGNKFSHHRPSKVQQSRLRELANSSSLLPNANSIQTLGRKATTLYRRGSSPQAPTQDSLSDYGAPISRTVSSELSVSEDAHQQRPASEHSVNSSSVSSDHESEGLEIAPPNRNDTQEMTLVVPENNTRLSPGGPSTSSPAPANGEHEEKSRRSTVLGLGKKVLNRINQN